jgi:hypothetical protein
LERSLLYVEVEAQSQEKVQEGNTYAEIKVREITTKLEG